MHWEGMCVGRVCALGGCVHWEGVWRVCVRKEGNVFSASEVQLNTYSHFIKVSTLIIGVIVTMVTRHHEMSFSPDDNWLKFSAKQFDRE